MISALPGWFPVMNCCQLSASQLMGLHAYRAGLPRIVSEQMVLRLAQDFFPLNEKQTRHLLQAAGFGVGRRIFRRSGSTAGWPSACEWAPCRQQGIPSSVSSACLMGKPPA
ncbi:hypothetical protein KGEDBEEJ_03656 [Aeromonas hydrophila]